jgi:hypothetical protein
MKTIRQWMYPAMVLASWIVSAAYTVSALPTVAPSLRSASAVKAGPFHSHLLAQREQSALRLIDDDELTGPDERHSGGMVQARR